MRHFDLLPVPVGYKIKLYHEHRPEKLKLYAMGKKPCRYQTVALLVRDDPTAEVVSFGWANCSPKDTPSRKLGRVIAHNRAISLFNDYASREA